MIRWLRSLFAWREAREGWGIWLYQENRVTGQRRALRISRCYSPVDLDWLDAGQGHPLINGRPAWRSAEGQLDGRYCY